MIEINKSLHGANGKIKAVYLGTTPVVVYLGDQLLYDVDLDAEYVLMDIEDGDTIDSTIEAPVKSAILKGQTLVNLIPNTTISWACANSSSWLYKYVELNQQLKPNTIYTIIANVLETNGDGTVSLTIGGKKEAAFQPKNVNVKKGRNVFTAETYSDGQGNLNFVFFQIQDNYVGNFTLNDFIILEGDHSNEDIPYFEGMQSVKMPVLTTIGKNLFDLELVQGSHGYGEVGIKPNFNMGNTRVTNVTGNYIKVNPKTKITFSISNDIVFAIAELDINGYSLGDTGWAVHTRTRTNHTITTKEKTSYIGFNFRKLDSSIITAQEVLDSNPMLEISDTATTYEPFKSNNLTVNEDVTLRGIGDVKDTLDLTTGELIQNVNEIVLTGNANEKWTKHEGLSTNEVATFVWKVEELKATGNVLCDKLSSKKMWSDKEIGIWFDSNLIISISSSIATTVEQLRTYLNETPFTVYYQSSEKSFKTVVLTIQDQDNKTISTLNTFNDTTHFTVQGEDGSLQPTVSMEIACNPSQSVMALADQTEQLQQEQQELTEQIEQQERDINILQTATTDLEEV